MQLLENIRFDVIFSEFCPKDVLNPYVEELLYNLLKEDGVIITPSYNMKIFKNMKKEILNEDYNIYIYIYKVSKYA